MFELFHYILIKLAEKKKKPSFLYDLSMELSTKAKVNFRTITSRNSSEQVCTRHSNVYLC